MKKFFVLVAVLATAAIAATPAFAGGTVTWTGNGSANLPCSGGEHWILSGNATVTGATLMFNGQVVGSFTQSGDGSWSVDTDLGVTADDINHVTAVWTGTGSPHLVLSHCASGTTTGGTTGSTTGATTGETTGATTGETTGATTGATTGETTGATTGATTGETTGATTGETTGATTGETTGATTGTTGTGGVSGATTSGTTGGTTGGSAGTPSGGNLPFTGLPVWMPLLAAAALLGSGILLIRRRKGEAS
jgi:hypothetical protein